MLMPTVNYLLVVAWEHIQQREQREMTAIGKTIEAAREEYEGLPI